MPHKLEKYRSYDTPYGESYSVDTKLWYNDDEEIFPIPVKKAEDISDFAISSLVGIGEWNDDIGYMSNDDEDIYQMVEKCLGNNSDEAYTFGIYITWQNKKIMFSWDYQYTKISLEKFIDAIEKGNKAKFYTDMYSNYKLFSFPINDCKIRLVVQDYNEESETFLMNIFDGIIDKQYFVISLRAVLKSAENYLLYYIKKYASERNFPKDLVEKAKIYAKNCK